MHINIHTVSTVMNYLQLAGIIITIVIWANLTENETFWKDNVHLSLRVQEWGHNAWLKENDIISLNLTLKIFNVCISAYPSAFIRLSITYHIEWYLISSSPLKYLIMIFKNSLEWLLSEINHFTQPQWVHPINLCMPNLFGYSLTWSSSIEGISSLFHIFPLVSRPETLLGRTKAEKTLSTSAFFICSVTLSPDPSSSGLTFPWYSLCFW